MVKLKNLLQNFKKKEHINVLKQFPVQLTKLTYAKATGIMNNKFTYFLVNKSTNSKIIKNISSKQNVSKIIYLKNNTNEAITEDLKSLKKCVSLGLNDTEVSILFVNDRNGNLTVAFSNKANKKCCRAFQKHF